MPDRDDVVDAEAAAVPRRIGGEIPSFADRFGPPQPWRDNWLAFSHGRAAMGWRSPHAPIASAALAAYTCPTVPQFLRQHGLPLALYDIGASAEEIAEVAHALPTPRLVIVPALFGGDPWLDLSPLQARLGAADVVLVDAAQTAFGHVDIALPEGGAVLSCPRKTTSLSDGAVLAVAEALASGAAGVDRLPEVRSAAAMKLAARALFAIDDPGLEAQALALNALAESTLPDAPHRMSDQARAMLGSFDHQWHRSTRRRNATALAASLRDNILIWPDESGTPFSLPIFVGNRDGVLAGLKDERVFATALWPDAECDGDRHPLAAWMRRHLISLPIDQRHDEADIARVAAVVNRVSEAPRHAPPV